MPFIAINAAEITVELDIPGDAGPAYVVFGVDGSTLLSASAISSALDAVLATANGFRNMLPAEVTITEFTTRFRSSPNVVEIDTSVLNLPGILVGPNPPPQVAFLFQKRSGLAGRTNRGRMYVPAASEAEIDSGGTLSSALITNAQGGANNFLADLAASSIPMVILHTNPAETPTAVSALTLSPKVATQRRRVR